MYFNIRQNSLQENLLIKCNYLDGKKLPSVFVWHSLKLIGSHRVRSAEDYDMMSNALRLHRLLKDNCLVLGRKGFLQHSFQRRVVLFLRQ